MMTDDEARKLAQRCIDTWPNGPKAYIWRDAVLPLDAGAAAKAYRALLNETEKTPTIGRFMAHYAALTRVDNGGRMIRWTGNEIGLDEYLTRLQARADMGGQDAADELGNWQRWLKRADA